MSGPLSMTDLDTITGEFVDELVEGIVQGEDGTDVARAWLEEQRSTLVGLAVGEVQDVLRSWGGGKEAAGRKYDELVAGFSFEEKLAFARQGVAVLRAHSSERIRLVGLLSTLGHVAEKAVPLLVALA